MGKVEEIEQSLSKIKALIDKEEQIYMRSEIFQESLGERRTFQDKIEFFRDNFSVFYLLKNFFSSDTINTLEERLKPLLKLHENFSSPDRNFTDKRSSLDEFYRAIDSLPNFSETSIKLPQIINKDDFETLLNLIRNKSDFFLDYDNESFLNKTSLLESKEGQEKLIGLYNFLISKNEKPISTIIYFNQFFNELIQNSRVKELEKEIQDLENNRQESLNEIANLKQKEVEVKREIAAQSNYKLQQIFDNEAEKMKPQITWLHRIIVFLFCFLIAIIFLAACMIFLKKIQNVSEYYVLYLSTFLTITALLSYLIREKNRIVKYQHYCQISYLEISALSDYTAQLNDKGKSEELKVQLAHRYFQGPNGHSDQTADKKDLDYFSSKVSELTNMVKDIKSLVDK